MLLAVVFLVVGTAKFRSPGWEARFTAWGYPAWFRSTVGALEVLGALMLLVPGTRRWGALALAIVMAGAAVTHVAHGEAPRVIVNVVIAVLLIAIRRLA